jgi:hypothetical protein
MSGEEVAVHSDNKVLMEFGKNNVLIVGDPRGILGKQLRPAPIHLLNTIIIIVT